MVGSIHGLSSRELCFTLKIVCFWIIDMTTYKSFMVHSIATYVYIIFLILQVVTLLTFKTDILVRIIAIEIL